MIAFLLRQKGRRTWRCRYRLVGETKIKEVSLHTADKQVAQQRLNELIREQEQEAAGIIPPKPLRAASMRELSEHLDEFVADLTTQGCSDKHLNNIAYRVGRLMRECQWTRVGDVTTDSFLAWRGRQKLAAKTINDYLGAISSLLNWMRKNGRILLNPLLAVEPVNTLDCETRVRRAFTDDEFRRLIAIAGKYKAVYLMAVYTGLRRSELAGLLWGDIQLDSQPPVVNVRKSIAKNSKDAIIPLHADLVVALRDLRNGTSDDLPVFERVPRIERFRRDLKRAGIAYQNGQGKFGDFHSLRKTFGTNLQKGGVAPRVAMELMRHSDMRLTMKIYTDVDQLPTAEAINIRPSFGFGGDRSQ